MKHLCKQLVNRPVTPAEEQPFTLTLHPPTYLRLKDEGKIPNPHPPTKHPHFSLSLSLSLSTCAFQEEPLHFLCITTGSESTCGLLKPVATFSAEKKRKKKKKRQLVIASGNYNLSGTHVDPPPTNLTA